MKRYFMILGVLASMLAFSGQSVARSYIYYENVVNEQMGKAAERNKAILSYKYSDGVLVILGKDGKKLDLKDGVYKMDDGDTFYVEQGAVVKHEKGKKKETKKEKKDKFKSLL